MREPAWTIGAVEALRQCETASYVCYVCRKVTSGLLAQTDKPLSHSSPRRTFDDRSSFNNVSLRSSTSWITRWQLPTQIHGWLPNLGDTSPRRLGAEVERRLGVRRLGYLSSPWMRRSPTKPSTQQKHCCGAVFVKSSVMAWTLSSAKHLPNRIAVELARRKNLRQTATRYITAPVHEREEPQVPNVKPISRLFLTYNTVLQDRGHLADGTSSSLLYHPKCSEPINTCLLRYEAFATVAAVKSRTMKIPGWIYMKKVCQLVMLPGVSGTTFVKTVR